MKQEIKDKLAEAIELWADENLEGKPALLANAVYFNLVSFLENTTKEINEKFSGTS